MGEGLLMVAGTMSGVGKSTLTTALCRLLAEAGLRVAPFKAQNMSLNAAVTSDGLEISRAQAVQAEAAGVAPSAAMNPILLKPEGPARSQVVVMGRPWRSLEAREYFEVRRHLRPVVMRALEELRRQFDVVVMEGAGSPAELNLAGDPDDDFVNLGLARAVGTPAVLVGDIERGGLFAQLLGTLQLLPPSQRARVQALVVNKFRGDPALFAEGVGILQERASLPVWGVLPYLEELALPGEDSLDRGHLTAPGASADGVETLDVALIALPHLSNADEFEPLAKERGVALRLVRRAAEVGYPDLLIVPGSKSTLADLTWLERGGFSVVIRRLAARRVPILGICGGFQMLGVAVEDPDGAEPGPNGEARPPAGGWAVPGIGLLPVRTRLGRGKTTRPVEGRFLAAPGVWAAWDGLFFDGYEIHGGQTVRVTRHSRPWALLTRQPGGEQVRDGSVAGSVAGTYCHGLLHSPTLRAALIAALWQERGLGGPPAALTPAGPADVYRRLAGWARAHLDLSHLSRWLGVPL